MEKKFRFERVLDIRIIQFEREEEKLFDLLKEEKEIRERMTQKRNEIVELGRKAKAEAANANFKILDLYRKFELRLEIEISSIAKELDHKLRQIQQQRIVLNKAYNDKVVFEKLKEKHTEQYKQYEIKQEIKFFDELTTNKFSRTMTEEL